MSTISSVVMHALVFVFAFSLEIRVRASEHAAAPESEAKDEVSFESSPVQIAQAEAPLQEPNDCVKTNRVCAVRTSTNEKFAWKSEGVTLTLDRGTAVLRETPTLVRLLSGTLWVEAKQGFTVRTEYGDVKVEGEAWVSRDGSRVVVSATSHDVIMKPRGSSEDILVKTGNQNWMSKVARATGEAETGLPTAIPLREHIERWARLYPGSVKDFRIAVRSFHGRWSSAAGEAAALHKFEYERKIASVRAEDQRKAEIARKREVEDKKLRELFRKKVFDGY